MKRLLTAGLLVLLLPAPDLRAQAPRAQAAAPAANLAYSQVCGEVVALLKRVAALPDAEALPLMRREGPPLQAKVQRLNPAYRQWLRTRTPAQQAAEEKRLMAQPWVSFLNQPDPRLAAMVKRNPELGQHCLGLMQQVAEGL